AFHYRALVLMSRLAEATERFEDANCFRRRAGIVERAFNEKLFDGGAGRYIDGEGSGHGSLHANLFPLAFGLVPADRIPGVLDHIRSRGMACSVYGAQHLLDALYRTGAEDYALELLTSTDDRSWGHMVEEGATMTWEGWDWKYKKNLDWNHPWGAAPANLIPRRLMGVRPLRPGFGKVLIQPQSGDLTSAECRVPTIRGPIDVRLENSEDVFKMEVHIPVNTAARAELPAGQGEVSRVEIDGVKQVCHRKGKYIVIDPLPPGAHFIELKRS
ncbi:MAG: alpha-L-rhamnosidase, partial [Planctomycetes bacterium]|nr:alpha-L-rhamnosidase [Planctomycetota bacterium]